MLIPPDAFGIVEPKVYRSNTIHPSNYSFVKKLGLKTVLILSPEVPTKGLRSFFEEIGANVILLGQTLWRSNLGWKPCPEELIKEGIEILLNYDTHPLMIMCASGIHESGTLVGCLRKLQRWSFNSILTEYQGYAANRNRYLNEQFIELFDLDLITLPSTLAPWFRAILEENP